MKAFTIKNSTHKILVVGPLYDQMSKLLNLEKIENNYDFIILNGNICYPFNDIKDLEDRIDILNSKPNKYIYNLGNYDLEVLNKSKSDKVNNWILSKSNVVIIEFKNQTRLIILNGGVKPQTTNQDLFNNLEVSFISHIENEPWHTRYGGGYGYIISNNPCTDHFPCFYNYSAQIGNKYSSNFKVYAQEADQYGLKETFLI